MSCGAIGSIRLQTIANNLQTFVSIKIMGVLLDHCVSQCFIPVTFEHFGKHLALSAIAFFNVTIDKMAVSATNRLCYYDYDYDYDYG